MKNLTLTILLFSLLLALSFSPASGQTRHKLVKEGNKKYQAGEYDEAIARYHTAARKGNLPQIDFNLGNAHYKSDNLERAMEEYIKSLSDTSATLRAKALYNLGNAYMKSDQPDKAIESYISSLMLNPDDLETKQNLEYALQQMIAKQKQEQKQQDKKDDKQDQQQQQQNQDKQQQQEQDQEKQQQNKDQQEQKEKKQDQNAQKEQQKPVQMSKEDAIKLLNALKDDEKEVQKKVMKQQMAGKKSKDKNW